MDINNKPKESEIIEIDRTQFKIPSCCSSGSSNCPHVAKKEKPKKQNIGL